jgi:predicted nucleotidyltransferase
MLTCIERATNHGGMDPTQPTADTLLEDLVSSIHTALGDDLVGIYLYGSYVSGGFDPGISDLDLVAVTSAEVETIDLRRLDGVHQDVIARHPDWVDRLEVVYVGRATLEAFRTSPGRLAVISPGEPFHLRDEPVFEWVQNWYLVRETGIVLFGPPAAAVIPPVAWGEFAAAAVRYAEQISSEHLEDASPSAIAYAVLTMCRALMTVQTQAHVSKQDGAAWTRRRMPEWAGVIDTALGSRASRGASSFDDADSRAAAQVFIGLVAARVREASLAG